MIYPTEIDWAYLAGLIDGEGNIGISGAGRSISLIVSLQIGSTDHHLLEWVAERFGGEPIRLINRTHAKSQWKPLWFWRVRGNRAIHILRRLQPLLVIKAQQAWLAQEAWEHRGSNPRGMGVPPEACALRRGFCLAMNFLNQKGAA